MSTRRDEIVRALDALKASSARIGDDVRDLGSDAILLDVSERELLDQMNRLRRDLDNHFIAIWREHKEFSV